METSFDELNKELRKSVDKIEESQKLAEEARDKIKQLLS